MCHPVLVLLHLQALYIANAKIGADRNQRKTEVIYCVSDLEQLFLTGKSMKFDLWLVHTAVCGNVTFADQLLAKADVIWVKHERVQLCQDPQTEFARLRESPGVTRKTRPRGYREQYGSSRVQRQSSRNWLQKVR